MHQELLPIQASERAWRFLQNGISGQDSVNSPRFPKAKSVHSWCPELPPTRHGTAARGSSGQPEAAALPLWMPPSLTLPPMQDHVFSSLCRGHGKHQVQTCLREQRRTHQTVCNPVAHDCPHGRQRLHWTFPRLNERRASESWFDWLRKDYRQRALIRRHKGTTWMIRLNCTVTFVNFFRVFVSTKKK